MMNEEKRLEFLRKLQELAEKKGMSLEDLIDKATLGELILWFWAEEGKKKEPEEVLHFDDMAELVKEIRCLRKNSQ